MRRTDRRHPVILAFRTTLPSSTERVQGNLSPDLPVDGRPRRLTSPRYRVEFSVRVCCGGKRRLPCGNRNPPCVARPGRNSPETFADHANPSGEGFWGSSLAGNIGTNSLPHTPGSGLPRPAPCFQFVDLPDVTTGRSLFTLRKEQGCRFGAMVGGILRFSREVPS